MGVRVSCHLHLGAGGCGVLAPSADEPAPNSQPSLNHKTLPPTAGENRFFCPGCRARHPDGPFSVIFVSEKFLQPGLLHDLAMHVLTHPPSQPCRSHALLGVPPVGFESAQDSLRGCLSPFQQGRGLTSTGHPCRQIPAWLSLVTVERYKIAEGSMQVWKSQLDPGRGRRPRGSR